MAKNKNKE